MQEESAKQVFDSNELGEKYPGYKYAVYFIEHEDIVQRKVGYSLLAPLFRLLPKELQEYIRYIWQIDTEKRKMPFSFVKCCNNIFMETDEAH